MKRVIAVIVLGLGMVLSPYTGYSTEILLTDPIIVSSLDRVIVDDISDHPRAKEMSIRLSIGFYNDPIAKTGWNEKKDFHMVVKNIPAVVDDPATPEDESSPADPKYNTLRATMRANPQNKTAEEIILELPEIQAAFPGTIQ